MNVRWLSPSITNVSRIEIAPPQPYQCSGDGVTRWLRFYDTEGNVQSFLVMSGQNPTIEVAHVD